MKEEETLCQTPLDQLIAQDSLQIMKAAVPYLPPRGQQMLSVYTKIKELFNTIHYFQQPQPELSIMSAPSLQPEDMLNNMRKYASGPMKGQIDQLLIALNTIQLIQMYQEQPEGGEN